MRAPSWVGPQVVSIALLVCGAVLAYPTVAEAQIWVVTEADGRERFTTQPEPGARLYLRTRHHAGGGLQLPEVPYGASIASAAANHAVDPALVQAVIRVESNFDSNAVSVDGARGLMQLMPATAADLGVNDAHDPNENVHAGTAHLARLLAKFDDLEMALAAYNAGEGAVERYGGIPPYPETQQYVEKVLGHYRSLRNE